MKTTFTLLTTLLCLTTSFAQPCPGGRDFSTAELFDEGWIYICNTGTSCNAGTTIFSNQSSCDPTVAIDPCAPTPGCGNPADMGSDLWFKFFANTNTASIKVTRNSSFIAAVQAFSASNFIPSCSQLTEVGCIADNSTNGTISLTLNSLTPGNLYFFRVFGVAHNASQRTGTFCFCGSTGLTPISLPVKLISFTASSSGKATLLKWSADQQPGFSYYEIEQSTGGNKFTSVAKHPVIYNGNTRVDYQLEERSVPADHIYYRLKMVDGNGKYGYSDIIQVSNRNPVSGWKIRQDNVNQRIIIYSDTETEAEIYTLTGNKLATYHLTEGNNSFSHDLKPGMYIIRKKDSGEAQRLAIY